MINEDAKLMLDDQTKEVARDLLITIHNWCCEGSSHWIKQFHPDSATVINIFYCAHQQIGMLAIPHSIAGDEGLEVLSCGVKELKAIIDEHNRDLHSAKLPTLQ